MRKKYKKKYICGKLKKYLTSYPPAYIIKDRLKKKKAIPLRDNLKGKDTS